MWLVGPTEFVFGWAHTTPVFHVNKNLFNSFTVEIDNNKSTTTPQFRFKLQVCRCGTQWKNNISLLILRLFRSYRMHTCCCCT